MIVRHTAEAAEERLSRVLRASPSLTAWIADGVLARGEADLVGLLVDATDRCRPMRVAVPGHVNRLAAVASIAIATHPLTNPGTRQLPGPVALVGAGPAHRSVIAELAAADISFARSLGTGALRRDGRVQPATGYTTPRAAEYRLILVGIRVGLPNPTRPFGVAIIDVTGVGSRYAETHAWALEHASVVHVIAPLTPGEGTSGYVVDWPYIRAQTDRWPEVFGHAWAASPSTRLRVVAPGPQALAPAQRRLAGGTKSVTGAWPVQLANAAALTRQLASLTVPVATYDAHTFRSIAVPIAERAERLREVKASDFPDGWRAFAELDWAPLKHDILSALEQLESHNPKSVAIGIAVEEHMATGEPLDIWVDNGAHIAALTMHLLTAGFAITGRHIEDGTLRLRTFSGAIDEGRPRPALIAGLPSPWQIPRLVAADFGGPLHVLVYPFEKARVPTLLSWAVNESLHAHAQERAGVLRMLLGDVICPAAPDIIAGRLSEDDAEQTATAEAGEWGVDVAEFAALAEDEWLALLPGEAQERRLRHSDEPLAVHAFLVEPGPSILLLAPTDTADRLVGGRVRPTPVTALAPGMIIIGANTEGRSIFSRLRPYLDRLNGTGTRFWLDGWQEALAAAAAKTGSSVALAAELVTDGATITPAAVAGWASPYRIGPQSRENVRRVAIIAGSAVVRLNSDRVFAVMRGVRSEHHRLGRALAKAVRRHADGDPTAFDAIEERLGVDMESLVGDFRTFTVTQVLGTGTAPANQVGRLLRPSEARTVFTTDEGAR